MEKSKSKKKSPIKKRSDKEEKRQEIYGPQAKAFLARPENHWCKVFPWMRATTVHHMKGKIEELLFDERFWVGLSLPGHRWVEEHPDEAKARFLSFDRLS